MVPYENSRTTNHVITLDLLTFGRLGNHSEIFPKWYDDDHQRCINRCNSWDKLPTSTGWCRVSEPSTRVLSQMVGLMLINPMVESVNKFFMDVSENSGTPQIIHFNRVFHYKPSILGYHYFWKHPYDKLTDFRARTFNRHHEKFLDFNLLMTDDLEVQNTSKIFTHFPWHFLGVAEKSLFSQMGFTMVLWVKHHLKQINGAG